eukprot:COSAG01_NODE_33_length_35013_cov_86.824144_22_plen_58_part_00
MHCCAHRRSKSSTVSPFDVDVPEDCRLLLSSVSTAAAAAAATAAAALELLLLLLLLG